MPQIELKRPDGQTAHGYLAEPSGAPRGNVVVIQEWWGLTDQIRGVCDRLAADGFRALAPDLYDGELAKNADEAGAKMGALDFGKAVSQYIRGSAQHLAGMPAAERKNQVTVLGFCMGGALTLLAAANVPEIASAVCFYGIPPEQFLDPSTIKIPLLAHFAKLDDWCTPQRVDQLERKLTEGNVPFTLHRYDAQHAFMNENRPEVHDPKNAEVAWERTRAFLASQHD